MPAPVILFNTVPPLTFIVPLLSIAPPTLFRLVSNVPAFVTAPAILPTSLLNVPPVIFTSPPTLPLFELSNAPEVVTLPVTFPPLLSNVPLFCVTLPVKVCLFVTSPAFEISAVTFLLKFTPAPSFTSMSF